MAGFRVGSEPVSGPGTACPGEPIYFWIEDSNGQYPSQLPEGVSVQWNLTGFAFNPATDVFEDGKYIIARPLAGVTNRSVSFRYDNGCAQSAPVSTSNIPITPPSSVAGLKLISDPATGPFKIGQTIYFFIEPQGGLGGTPFQVPAGVEVVWSTPGFQIVENSADATVGPYIGVRPLCNFQGTRSVTLRLRNQCGEDSPPVVLSNIVVNNATPPPSIAGLKLINDPNIVAPFPTDQTTYFFIEPQGGLGGTPFQVPAGVEVIWSAPGFEIVENSSDATVGPYIGVRSLCNFQGTRSISLILRNQCGDSAPLTTGPLIFNLEPTITGPPTICNTFASNFTLILPGITINSINWSLAPGSIQVPLVTSGPNNSIVSITPPAGVQGLVLLRASVNTSCGIRSVTKEIVVGGRPGVPLEPYTTTRTPLPTNMVLASCPAIRNSPPFDDQPGVIPVVRFYSQGMIDYQLIINGVNNGNIYSPISPEIGEFIAITPGNYTLLIRNQCGVSNPYDINIILSDIDCPLPTCGGLPCPELCGDPLFPSGPPIPCETICYDDFGIATICPFGLGFSISPNPANDLISINSNSSRSTQPLSGTTRDLSSTSINTQTQQVVLYNKYSQVVRQGILNNGAIQLSVSELPEDIYYIHIIENGKIIERKQIVISRK